MPALRRPCALPSLELASKSVETALPEAAVLRDPCVQFAERLGPQRIDVLLRIDSHRNEPLLAQYTQVARNTRLAYVHCVHDVADGAFAVPERIDDASSRRI